jgi:1-acyl-sn-glycerol-3-phosphate acyltransferase
MYARHLFWVFGVKVKVSGIENLPETNNVCFVSNHQGAADIPLIVGFIPKKVGFIAKKELGRIPMLNVWMKALGCILIDRKDIRQSLKVIDKGVHQIQKGHPLVVFAEGTRSRGPMIGKFKPGAFKLLSGNGTLAVPLTISGTYKVMEERGIITPTHVQLTIHPAIDIAKLSDGEKKELPERIFQKVKSAI